ncbi:SMP-30/gluconolactonase/LRE family protein [Kitasatospora sp. NPDC057015]|uniref:SMP-30/gluconolactonase/LRE family protein n=1 Tax=Kitasatospora sp. NPDC057015 TaxID=3346001 RepID=UPI00363C8E23
MPRAARLTPSLRTPARLTPVAATAAVAAALVLLGSSPAVSVAPPLSNPRVVAHFDIATGQTPENLVLEPDGSADVTLAAARQVARVALDGSAPRIIATLPPAAPTPVVGFAAVSGIARGHDGTLYVNYATGDALSGVWRISPGGPPEQLAALPPDGLPNGLALDERRGVLYAAESTSGTIWRVSLHRGPATAWATAAELRPTAFLGANGVRLHDGAVWVSNTDRGTVLRIPVRPDGAAGPVETRVTGIDGIDDFGFTGPHGDTLLAARNVANEVVYVAADGTRSVVLTQPDGLSNPTSVAVRGGTVYVTGAAFFTRQDPNLLLATLRGRHP